jgi:hypothetical protein
VATFGVVDYLATPGSDDPREHVALLDAPGSGRWKELVVVAADMFHEAQRAASPLFAELIA